MFCSADEINFTHKSFDIFTELMNQIIKVLDVLILC